MNFKRVSTLFKIQITEVTFQKEKKSKRSTNSMISVLVYFSSFESSTISLMKPTLRLLGQSQSLENSCLETLCVLQNSLPQENRVPSFTIQQMEDSCSRQSRMKSFISCTAFSKTTIFISKTIKIP